MKEDGIKTHDPPPRFLGLSCLKIEKGKPFNKKSSEIFGVSQDSVKQIIEKGFEERRK